MSGPQYSGPGAKPGPYDDEGGTDTVTPRDPWPILRAVLETVRPDELFSSATWHEAAELAQLNSREIVHAQNVAVDAGYLERLGSLFHGEFLPSVVKTVHEKGKGRWVFAYRRTDKTFPDTDALDAWADAESERRLTLGMTPEELLEFHRRAAEHLDEQVDGQLSLIEVP